MPTVSRLLVATALAVGAVCARSATAEVRADVLAGVETVERGGYVVVLDPGHGGKDQGTSGNGTALEKDVVLSIASVAAAHLEASDDVRVLLTREDDRFVTLDDRVRIARMSGADLFVSIHANSAPSPRARGAEVYFLDLDGASDETAAASADRENAALVVGHDLETTGDDLMGILVDLRGTHALRRSADLAEVVLQQFRADDVVAGRTVRQANFAVLRTLSMPSILLEVGFLSHAAEAALLARPEGQSRIGLSLARAVVEYLRRSGERGEPEALPSLRVHTVRRGDTLWRLATRAGWSVERLRAANALDDAGLRVGQTLVVPDGADSGR